MKPEKPENGYYLIVIKSKFGERSYTEKVLVKIHPSTGSHSKFMKIKRKIKRLDEENAGKLTGGWQRGMGMYYSTFKESDHHSVESMERISKEQASAYLLLIL